MIGWLLKTLLDWLDRWGDARERQYGRRLR